MPRKGHSHYFKKDGEEKIEINDESRIKDDQNNGGQQISGIFKILTLAAHSSKNTRDDKGNRKTSCKNVPCCVDHTLGLMMK
jgi:hypothetical protein